MSEKSTEEMKKFSKLVESKLDNLSLDNFKNLIDAPYKEHGNKFIILSGEDSLHARKIGIMPEELEVYGNLYLGGSTISKMPTKITIHGNLFMNKSKFNVFPAHCEVGANLYLNGATISSLPHNLKVGYGPANIGYGKGSLDIRNTNISILSKDIDVNGYIFVNEGQIPNIPGEFKDKIKFKGNPPKIFGGHAKGWY